MGLRKNESKVSNKGIANLLTDTEKLHLICPFHNIAYEECKRCLKTAKLFIDKMNYFTVDFHPSKCSNKFEKLNGKLTETLPKQLKKIKIKVK